MKSCDWPCDVLRSDLMLCSFVKYLQDGFTKSIRKKQYDPWKMIQMVEKNQNHSVPMTSRLSQKSLCCNAIPKEDAFQTTDASYPLIPTAIPVNDPTFLLTATPVRETGRCVVSKLSTSVSPSPLTITNVALSVTTGVVLFWWKKSTNHNLYNFSFLLAQGNTRLRNERWRLWKYPGPHIAMLCWHRLCRSRVYSWCFVLL